MLSGTMVLILGSLWMPNGGAPSCKDDCEDFDYCKEEMNICGRNATCVIKSGEYECSCKEGFSNTRNKTKFKPIEGECKDTNECWYNETICGKTAKCVNTIGNYNCNCLPGYRNFSEHSSNCTDIDECTEGTAQKTVACRLKGSCSNLVGSYLCNCSSGYTNYGHERTECSELQCDQFKVDTSLPGLANVLSLMRNNCLALSDPKLVSGEKMNGVTLLQTLFSATEDILSHGQLNNSHEVSGMLGAVEKGLKLIVPQLKDNITTRETNHTEMQLAVWRGETPPTGPVHLTTNNANLTTDWRIATGSGPYTGIATAALVNYKNLEKSVNWSFEHLQEHQKDGRGPSYQIASKVVSVVVSNPSTQHLNESVTLTFRHLENREESSQVNYTCIYWEPGQNDGGAWSTRGCSKQFSNDTYTECSCSHLSSFAVLMALYPNEDPFELVVFTKLGLTISLLCLAVSILTFQFCHSIKGTRTTIHLHLCVCLFFANLIFLTGISQTKPEVACRFVAAMLHFFFLGAFSWMLLEGVQLYRMLVLVFNANMRRLYMFAAGYGPPLVIVGISAISRPNGYGTNRHCWLSLEHGLIWSFFGPVCLIIILNIFFFIITVWKLTQKFSSLNPELSNLHKIKVFTVTAIAQLCVLGLTWVSGVFLFQEGATIAAYIFTILNSLQGVLIFIMHCLFSKQVREEYAKFFCLREKQQKKYSEFSNTVPLQSLSK
ncbi:putative adhesion G protein-coupled receptor E4P [Lampris incognitus]|uniref:putative adhesion G protein-coupled receptor E4P n=1 Tax=Lampris incognitus TaxID=2546036 RepID=UPI0024B48EF7|nr:putative adhesion G protein-coupled receptor E4P [Lampris incognitus]